MLIQTEKESFMDLATMKSMEEKLPAADLVRVHRSYIVRIDKINAIEDMMVIINRKAIPISSSYWESVKKSSSFLKQEPQII
jgi:DNA-binding LytR/AlgR family response regulator